MNVGELRPPSSVTVDAAWNWRADTSPRQIEGLWLYEPAQGRPAVWAGTFTAGDQGTRCAVAPGKYLGVVFGHLGEGQGFAWPGTFGGFTGTPLSQPFALEVRADGSVVPARAELLPAAPPGNDGK